MEDERRIALADCSGGWYIWEGVNRYRDITLGQSWGGVGVGVIARASDLAIEG